MGKTLLSKTRCTEIQKWLLEPWKSIEKLIKICGWFSDQWFLRTDFQLRLISESSIKSIKTNFEILEKLISLVQWTGKPLTTNCESSVSVCFISLRILGSEKTQTRGEGGVSKVSQKVGDKIIKKSVLLFFNIPK